MRAPARIPTDTTPWSTDTIEQPLEHLSTADGIRKDEPHTPERVTDTHPDQAVEVPTCRSTTQCSRIVQGAGLQVGPPR